MTSKKEDKKLTKGEKIFLIFGLITMLVAVFYISWGIADMEMNPEKYEQAAYERAMAEQEYNERHTYEILSVEEYTRISTNNWGAVVDQSPAYSIWYKDPNHAGGVDLIEDIEFPEYGIHKMVLTEDIDTITFKQDGGVIVRLTEKTMRGM